MAGTRRQRYVDIGPGAAALAVFFQHSGVGRVVIVLVHRHGQHGRIVEKGVLLAVAVVHVPIDDGDARHLVFALGALRGQHIVGEHAEAARQILFGMVAGRAHQAVGVVHRSGGQGIQRRQAAAGRQSRNFKTAGPDGHPAE